MTKMYIAVRDDVPDYMVPTLVAHSVLGAWMARSEIGSDEYFDLFNLWSVYSFKKCVVKVNAKQFEQIKKIPNVYLGHENTTLNGDKSCGVIVVEDAHPYKVLQWAKLWSPNG